VRETEGKRERGTGAVSPPLGRRKKDVSEKESGKGGGSSRGKGDEERLACVSFEVLNSQTVSTKKRHEKNPGKEKKRRSKGSHPAVDEKDPFASHVGDQF